jgi:hypothetical protein
MKNPGAQCNCAAGAEIKQVQDRSSNPSSRRNDAPRLSARRDAPVICSACGRRVARKARQQRYCSDRCRDFARRENKARTAIKNPVAVVDTRQPTKSPKTSSENNKLQGAKSASTLPLNLLGGYRWSNSITIDSELLRKIIIAEIGRNTPKKKAR